MTSVESAVLRDEAGEGTPRLLIRSMTSVDAGRWLRRTPLLLAVMEKELVVFAAARRRYSCRVKFLDCRESSYDHSTGELSIAPAEELTFKRVAVSPSDALRVLRLLGVVA